jgi:hypothetical protein
MTRRKLFALVGAALLIHPVKRHALSLSSNFNTTAFLKNIWLSYDAKYNRAATYIGISPELFAKYEQETPTLWRFSSTEHLTERTLKFRNAIVREVPSFKGTEHSIGG